MEDASEKICGSEYYVFITIILAIQAIVFQNTQHVWVL